ncbi:MAG: ribosome-associated translation inhibitor RaiA [Trichodesmium sp. St2_bin6]|nr:ribosome-associated translation inhibitor RaiA [Trichodesmium sp. MAG_R01]MDE5072401.1 ribosome-associated translation inhibitor RaiA [Trichodesmium sp. St5_bin8]MDE5078227.1 ribosome-associated translation inhibitor RaiA [Trichodesmium sp. St2_bin6]MDE5101456.1 ribosome-associated translation inhibitor RaiA [Trichodesmium sp. St19_bin2]
MKLVIQGKNIEITNSIHEYVNQKIEKAVNHFQQLTTEVDVHLSVARNPRINPKQTAEVTIYANGTVIRAQESSENLYASIDLVADKIARQLRKYKEKRQSKVNKTKTVDLIESQPVVENLIADRQAELPSEVVRTKYFPMPSMTVEEALEQLQLIDHDFYMFCNGVTGKINVIYKRYHHGGYGLIQPRPNGNENGNNGKASNSISEAVGLKSTHI